MMHDGASPGLAADDDLTRKTQLGVLRFGTSAGCGCKVDWRISHDLAGLPIIRDSLGVQLGLGDAARLDGFPGAAASIDFVGPVAREAADYGHVAAAHALSDLFASGVQPRHALVIAAWPREADPQRNLPLVLDGVLGACRSMGVTVVGGHTVFSEQPLIGLCGFGDLVAGEKKAPLAPGDTVYLTKPLGSGVAITAMREESCPTELEAAALATMRAMNTVGLALNGDARVKMVTDVTGFGLAGQALRLVENTDLAVAFHAGLPALPHVRDLIARGAGSSPAERNLGMLASFIAADDHIDRTLACDPQTNGPLLVVGGGDLAKDFAGLTAVGIVEKRKEKAVVFGRPVS